MPQSLQKETNEKRFIVFHPLLLNKHTALLCIACSISCNRCGRCYGLYLCKCSWLHKFCSKQKSHIHNRSGTVINKWTFSMVQPKYTLPLRFKESNDLHEIPKNIPCNLFYIFRDLFCRILFLLLSGKIDLIINLSLSPSADQSLLLPM